MRILFLILILTSVVGCKSTEKQNHVNGIISNFNQRATESYAKNYANSEDFKFMKPVDKCILDKTIAIGLDDINKSITTVVDSFYIRSYWSYDLLSDLTFIATEDGDCYFINIPQFQQFHYSDKYYMSNRSKLKDSTGNYMIKLESPMIDKFIQERVHSIRDYKDQIEQTDRLLSYLIRDIITERTFPFLLKDSISKRPDYQIKEIMHVLEPIWAQNDTHWSEGYQVYQNYLGFIVLDFKKDKNENLELDWYFVPFLHRRFFTKDYDPIARDCARQFYVEQQKSSSP